MILLTAAATAFLLSCAPTVGVQTMAGLIEHESGWHEFAINDNTEHRAYFPSSYFAAIYLARGLLRRGDNIDAGLAQINSANWPAYGLTPYTVFEPCSNVRVGANILSNNYREAEHLYPSGDPALTHALSMYHSGRPDAALSYAERVITNARAVRYLGVGPAPSPPKGVAQRVLPVRAAPTPHPHANPGPDVLRWALPVRDEGAP